MVIFIETYEEGTLFVHYEILSQHYNEKLGPTQPPILLVPGVLSLGVKRPGREADHSPASSDEVKNAWSYTSTPQRLHSVVLS
jgi:hypothetical protein